MKPFDVVAKMITTILYMVLIVAGVCFLATACFMRLKADHFYTDVVLLANRSFYAEMGGITLIAGLLLHLTQKQGDRSENPSE